MGNDYQFVTEWRVAGTIDEVKAVLGDDDGTAVTRWWPAVYLTVDQLEDGGDGGLGKVLDLHTKGWLPYTLRWTLTVTEPLTDDGYALEATGDLAGTGRWTFRQDGPEVVIIYDWRIHATKPLLRRLGWLLKPAFAANHHWAMKTGEESLRLELRRRRQTAAAATAGGGGGGGGRGASPSPISPIPPPPPATFARLMRSPRP